MDPFPLNDVIGKVSEGQASAMAILVVADVEVSFLGSLGDSPAY